VFPHVRSLSDPEQLEEERRLCYVGLTRAQDRLYLTHADHRTLWGGTSYNPPSRFLDECPTSSSSCAAPPRPPRPKRRRDAEVLEVAGAEFHVGDRVLHTKFGRAGSRAVRRGRARRGHRRVRRRGRQAPGARLRPAGAGERERAVTDLGRLRAGVPRRARRQVDAARDRFAARYRPWPVLGGIAIAAPWRCSGCRRWSARRSAPRCPSARSRSAGGLLFLGFGVWTLRDDDDDDDADRAALAARCCSASPSRSCSPSSATRPCSRPRAGEHPGAAADLARGGAGMTAASGIAIG
jgi:hypothetical protein